MAVSELGSSGDGDFWGHSNFIEQIGLAVMRSAFFGSCELLFRRGAPLHPQSTSVGLLGYDGDPLLGAHDAQQLRPL